MEEKDIRLDIDVSVQLERLDEDRWTTLKVLSCRSCRIFQAVWI